MKYENTNPLEKLHPGEPYFFIRSTDAHAYGAVRDYAARIQHAGDNKGALECMAFADRIKAWQTDNPHLVKEPD